MPTELKGELEYRRTWRSCPGRRGGTTSTGTGSPEPTVSASTEGLDALSGVTQDEDDHEMGDVAGRSSCGDPVLPPADGDEIGR